MSQIRRHHFLQKLMFRELVGEFRQCRSKSRERLFHQLPNRLAFSLSHIAPASAFSAGHVFLGFTKCGQFILSYTHSCDTDDHTLQIIHRYRLHWWLFTPYCPLRKVAEVMLFGGQDLQESICENVYISVCQWPKDLSKILVYGCSLDGGDGGLGPQTRKVYITITAVPSLDNCSACYQVATSYEEDEVAERWNSCVRFSCLRHGITVHTSFEMVPPFPRFMPTVQMKIEGHVVLNAGNFIHVLSVNLEHVEKKPKETIYNDGYSSQAKEVIALNSEESEDDDSDNQKRHCNSEEYINENNKDHAVITVSSSTEDEEHCDNLKISLRDQHNSSDKDREWEILIGNVPNPNPNGSGDNVNKRPAVEYPLYRSSFQECDIKSIDSDCSSVAGDTGKTATVNTNIPNRSPFLSICDDAFAADSDDSFLCYKNADECGTPRREKHFSGSFSNQKLHSHLCYEDIKSTDCNSCHEKDSSCDEFLLNTLSKQAEKEYEFIDEITEARHEKLSVFRRRRLAEKKYEFSDENSENIPLNYRSFRSQSRRLILSPSRSPRMRTFNVPFSELSVELGETSGVFRSVYEKLISPSGGASSSDVLKPINQNISSPVLSPRDEKWREDFDKLEKSEMQRWSSRESLCLYSPVSYSQKFSETISNVTHVGGRIAGPQKLNCVVDIKRRYIEVEDELVSIITDIEDDELSSATGYHNALSLEVHGSGYSQMHMISNSKAEKLVGNPQEENQLTWTVSTDLIGKKDKILHVKMAPGVLVRQVSLDVEQFCHETAQRLCNEAGKKYYFCNDYNVEVIDVCPSSGNVIALASVLVQAGNPKAKPVITKPFRGPVIPHALASRRLYRASATFVFNVDTKIYYLIDQEPLVEEDPYSFEVDMESMVGSESGEEQWWHKSRIAARQLGSQYAVPVDYFSSIKVLTNEPVLKGTSLALIMEGYHLLALVMGNTNPC